MRITEGGKVGLTDMENGGHDEHLAHNYVNRELGQHVAYSSQPLQGSEGPL